MGGFGDFKKHEKKKMSKKQLEEKTKRSMYSTGTSTFVLPKIIEKKRG